jgi:SAM-dependent methyltransferase
MKKLIRKTAKAAHRVVCGKPYDSTRITQELIQNRIASEPHLRPILDEFTDDMARLHFGEDEPLEAVHLRLGIRYFHAWRVHTLCDRIGPKLPSGRFLDVGDTDGLILKHLGKSGIGFNLSPAAIRNIESHGIEGRLGDGHGLPFADGEFDYVLCFETLEHVENPHQVLTEISRVCKPSGRIFVSIPWVPRTFVHPRDPDSPRGYMHMFEFCRKDFLSLVSHTPLTVEWDTVCCLLGEPATLEQRVFLRQSRHQHIVAGTFRQFQFFELKKTAAN